MRLVIWQSYYHYKHLLLILRSSTVFLFCFDLICPGHVSLISLSRYSLVVLHGLAKRYMHIMLFYQNYTDFMLYHRMLIIKEFGLKCLFTPLSK